MSIAAMSCGDKKAGSSSSAASEKAEAAAPISKTMFGAGASGDYADSFWPEISAPVVITPGAENGDNVAVECVVTVTSKKNATAKEIKKLNLSLYYADKNMQNVDVTPVGIDPAEIPAAIEFINSAKAGDKKEFKFKGEIKKAEFEALKGAENVSMNFTDEEID